jgi:two-component system sensor histidine kinase/response regulator
MLDTVTKPPSPSEDHKYLEKNEARVPARKPSAGMQLTDYDRSRFSNGADTSWLDLVDHQTTLNGGMSLADAQDFFRGNPDVRFAAVIENGELLGLASEQKIGNVLSQWGLGYAVFSNKPLRNHILERDCRIMLRTPIYRVLDAVMRREQDFFDDVMLINREGEFQGIITVRTLMHLQHEISRQQYDQIKDISEELAVNNEELSKARDIAFEAARMKSAFLANMSHEIRTPMNGILGMVKILHRTPLNDQQKRYLETVRNSGNALLTILNDILDFSKIEAGKLELESLDFDMATVVDECVQLLSERAQEKSLELFSWIDPGVRTLLISDPFRLRQIVLNLTSNAIKFTEKGEICVRVTQEAEDKHTATLRIAVSDTGIGISEEQQKRLFEAFQQADGTTSRRFGGTGLGLTISRRLVELLGGEMGLESEVGKGSTFWFKVPFTKQAGIEADPASTSTEDLRGMRVLITEKSAALNQAIQQILDPWNVMARTADSDESAFELLSQNAEENQAFDTIILDRNLPGGGTDNLVERIRSHEKLKKTAILISTSDPESFPPAKLREWNLSGLLRKPIQAQALREALLRAREHRSKLKEGKDTALESSTAEPQSESRMSESWDTDIAIRPLDILLVEDSAVNREVARIQLDAWGHRIDEARHGLEALDKVRQNRYDCILLDCQMPEMDGYEATGAIRDPATKALQPDIYIIAMTANALQGDREKCLQAGMNDYVSKPVEDKELLRALKAAEEYASKSEKTPPSPPEPAQATAGTNGSAPAPASPPAGFASPPATPKKPAFPQRLIDLFIEETGERIHELETAVQEENAKRIREISHTIKGTAGNFHANTLAEMARDFEQAGRAGDTESVRNQFDRFKSAYLEIKEELSA